MVELLEEYREQNRRPDSDFEADDSTREVIPIRSLDDLPPDAKKLFVMSELQNESELVIKHIDIFLYVMRFLTRKIFRFVPSEENVDLPGDPSVHSLTRRPPAKSKTTQNISLEEAYEKFIQSGNPKKIFKMVEDAGRGGFGSVFLARNLVDKSKQQRVAIKKMSHVNEREMWSNFDEIYFLQQAAHPCVVKYQTAYMCRDEIWLVMEYMEGGTLQDAVQRIRFEESHIAFVTKEILRGLKNIHEKGLVHRDLKSPNIMLSIQGDVKLIDFGLCVDVNAGTQTTMVGSPFWIPPEMIRREQHDAAADIWSLAILCLEMANQRPPFRKSALKAMFYVGSGVPPVFDDESRWSPAFRTFLKRMLVFDPKQRAPARDLLNVILSFL